MLFFRDQDITRAEHVAFARHFGELEDHPVAGSDPDNPGLVRIYKSPDQPNDHYENAWHSDATWREKPPFGCVLRCVECPPVGGDTMWANMVEAYARLPDDVKTQDRRTCARATASRRRFGAAMPIEKRLALHAQYPDAEHPVVRTHPETGEKVLFVNAFTTHFTNYHTPENVRFGQDASPGASQLLELPDQPGVRPRVPGALALEAEQHGDLGQPLHAALRGDGLPALPSQDGARRHHRRQAVLEASARHFGRQRMYRHMMVPLDDSPLSFDTVRKASCSPRARREGHVPPRAGGLRNVERRRARARDLARRVQRTHRRRGARDAVKAEVVAREAGVDHDSVAVTSDRPYEAILETAERRGCDLIFMASHGKRGLKGLVLGSQTQKVLQQTTIPVLVRRWRATLPGRRTDQAAGHDRRRASLARCGDPRPRVPGPRSARHGTPPSFGCSARCSTTSRSFPRRCTIRRRTRTCFRKLRERTSEFDETLAELERQHVTGRQLVEKLERSIARYEADPSHGFDAFAAAVARFATAQMQHMRLESKVILPAARQHLTAEDWAEMDRAFADERRPALLRRQRRGVPAALRADPESRARHGRRRRARRLTKPAPKQSSNSFITQSDFPQGNEDHATCFEEMQRGCCRAALCDRGCHRRDRRCGGPGAGVRDRDRQSGLVECAGTTRSATTSAGASSRATRRSATRSSPTRARTASTRATSCRTGWTS